MWHDIYKLEAACDFDNIYVRKNDTTNIYSDQVHIFEVSVLDIDFIFFPSE